MDETTRALVEHGQGVAFADIAPRTLWNAKARILDSIGCALAAFDAPPVAIARRLAWPISAGDPGSRLLGTLARTAPDAAAFAHTMMIRYLDFNDAYRTVDGSHPSDPIGAMLAVADMANADPRTLLCAVVAAYDVQCAFADTVPLNAMGWDHSIPEVVAGALGCARILGLPDEQTAQAVSLAISPNLATHQRHVGELSMWKAGYAAMAARQAVFAALMAREGMTGPIDPFEGDNGFWAQIRWRERPLRALAGPGIDPGVTLTNIKRWPVRDSCQLPIDTALELRGEVKPANVRALRVAIYASASQDRAREPEMWAPMTRETADHSLPFLVCAALLDGAVTIGTFDRQRFLDTEVRALMAHCDVAADDEYSRQAPAIRNCRIEAELEDGRTVTVHRTRASRPDYDRAQSHAPIDAKFIALVEPRLGAARARAFADALWNLESVPSVGTIIEMSAIAG